MKLQTGIQRLRFNPFETQAQGAQGAGSAPAPGLASSLLIHANGPGVYDFSDSSANAIAVPNSYGCQSGSVGQGQFGSRGILPQGFIGLEVQADAAKWSLLDGAFGIDCWINGSGGGNGLFILTSKNSDFNTMTTFGLISNEYGNRLSLWNTTSQPYNAVSAIGTANVASVLSSGPTHIAFTREDDGSTCHFFINGVLDKTFTFAGALDFGRSGNPLVGGGWRSGFSGNPDTSLATGVLSEFRVVKGKCPWKDAFTPPTAAYTS